MQFHKPKLIPLIMSVGGVLTMLYLGIWQLQRLGWKEGLIADIETAAANAPMQQLPSLDEALDKRFYTVQITGEYLPEPEFHIAARYYQSQLGYHVFTPFVTTQGEQILVNRGWIPAKQKDSYKEADDLTGKRTILAQIRTSNERNPYTPINQPDQNVWFGRDMLEMGEYGNIQVLPYSLDLIGEQKWGSWPVPSTGEIKLRNDHLGYAITWLLIGLGIFIISLLYHRKKPEEIDKQS